MTEDMNRLKLILVEKKKTSKWLADELGVPPLPPCRNGARTHRSPTWPPY